MVTCERCGIPSPTGSRFCGVCGASLAAESGKRDARKVVTALFCDIVGSTALASKLDPETVHRVFSRYFEDIGATIARHGGAIEKFAGDAIFAVFGIPTLHEDDALRAVRAAAEIRERLPALAAEVGLELEFHIALNTGLVHTDEKRSLAIGDTVNVAARLQQAAGPGEILLGPDTMRLLRGVVRAEPLEPLRLKGKPEPVAAFRLLAVDEDASGLAPRMAGPLLGRERELRLLHAAWRRTLAADRCHALTIVAPAGIGKSRLAGEFLRELHDGITVLRGRCLHYGEGITFWPLREALTPLGEVAHEVLDRLTYGGVATSEELFLSVRRLLESVAGQSPLILLIEDLHWAEPMLLELLGHMVELSSGAAILLLCTARNELLEDQREAVGPIRRGSILRLEPLARSACEELLRQLDRELPAGTRERVIAVSGGNPLFLEEMAALARESGRVEVPPTIQALLSARIEQLPAPEREPLECGAVEGYVFHRAAVEALLGARSREGLPERLFSLQSRQLISPHPGTVPGQAAFRFRHQLLRDAAYERLPLARRAGLHERFAAWAEAEAAGAATLDEIVGWHLEQATQYRRELRLEVEPTLPVRAAQHLFRAGVRAGQRGDVAAAQSLLERALALAPADDQLRFEVSVTLAERLIEAGDLERADELLALAERGEVVSAHAVLSRLEWRFFSEIGDLALESTLAGMLAELAREGDERGQARAHWLLFLLRWRKSRATPAAEQARLAAEHARNAGDVGLWSRALGWYVATLIYGTRSAAEVAAELDAIEREQPGPYLAACVALGRAEVERRGGRFAEAHALAGRALAAFRELRMPVMAATCEQSDAGISLSEGDAAAACASLLRSDAILAEFDERAVRSTTLAMLAQAHEQLGAAEEARAALERAEEMSAPGDVVNFVITHCARARLAVMSQNASAAARWARSAVEQAGRSDFARYQAEAMLELARVLFVGGRVDEARTEASRALELFQATSDLPGAEAAQRVIVAREAAEIVPLLPGAGP